MIDYTVLPQLHYKYDINNNSNNNNNLILILIVQN